MGKYIQTFKEMSKDKFNHAGGKGGALVRLFQRGYPVPVGFVVFSVAFEKGKLKDEAREEIRNKLQSLRNQEGQKEYAVRSSALSEDSMQASYAGEFETVLNVKTVEDIIDAINKVVQSKKSGRVKVYSEVKGFKDEHEMAVVIQEMIYARLSGVLFTTDPISKSEETMVGNYIHGIGEKLVSGDINPQFFTLKKPGGKYKGPSELKEYAQRIFKLGEDLENELGCPQDIEWAIAGGKLFLLQSRPITTLIEKDPLMANWNDSKKWNFLWTNVNGGEALPEVITPATWSLWKIFHNKTLPVKISDDYPFAGLIGGRCYFNISLLYSIYKLIMKPEDALHKTEEALGKIPEEVNIPEISFSKLLLVRTFFKNLNWEFKYIKLKKKIPEYIDTTPDWCKGMRKKIKEVKLKKELFTLWQEEIYKYLFDSFWMLRVAMILYSEPAEDFHKELKEIVGEEDANTLLSNINEGKELASLGPVLGLSKLAKGEMTRDEFIEKYGHRAPNELELAEPRPYEKTEWIDKRLKEFEKNSIDVWKLLEKQHSNFEAAWERIKLKYPDKENKFQIRIKKVSEYGRKREGVRSEVTRVIDVVRQYYLQAGELTKIKEDIFFLSYREVLQLLKNNEEPLKYIPERHRKYREYKSLPDYPTFIIGNFDPFVWAADPERSCDFYNENSEKNRKKVSDYIKGFAGASGKAEGIVRVLNSPDEGEYLKKGEIMVTSKTNIGWTPLFPVAAAIITDVGAPLSHAAIVARELGIPAVVGCGNATQRLTTGDRVIVDGGKGLVKIIENK